jgi:hypothetical protein
MYFFLSSCFYSFQVSYWRFLAGISFNGLQDQATKLKDAEVLLEQNQREMERLLNQLSLADR